MYCKLNIQNESDFGRQQMQCLIYSWKCDPGFQSDTTDRKALSFSQKKKKKENEKRRKKQTEEKDTHAGELQHGDAHTAAQSDITKCALTTVKHTQLLLQRHLAVVLYSEQACTRHLNSGYTTQ